MKHYKPLNQNDNAHVKAHAGARPGITIAITAITIAIAIAVIASCAQPPEEEMAAARQAVQEAERNPDVPQYAPRPLEEARQLLSQMESAAENRQHDTARTLAGQARTTAQRAVQDATTAKDNARTRARAAITAATSSMEEAQNTLDNARGVSGVRLDFQAIRSDLDTQAREIAAAETAFGNDQFAEAESRAENARSSLSELVQRISDAVRVASGRK